MTTDPDPFERLGVPATFELDAAVLRERVVRLSLRLHPDRAPDRVTAELNTRELAAINEAVRVLEDDVRRAEALLSMRGGPSASEDRTLPDGFLESMLAVRMDLEEALSTGDAEGTATLEVWARERQAHHRSTVASLFNGEVSDLVAIRHELNVWRYIERMIMQLRESDRGAV